MDRQLPEEKHFYLNSGKKLGNISDLIEALQSIDEPTFRYHVDSEKNDFAAWVRDCFENNSLADEISRLQTKEEILKQVQKELFKHKARKLFAQAGFFKDGEQMRAPESSSDLGADSMAVQNEDVSSKLTEVVQREKAIEEQEDLLNRRVQSWQRMASRDFVHGIFAGLVVAVVFFIGYVLFRF